MSPLPPSIIWESTPLKLQWYLPKIWTQDAGRPFGIYWSSVLKHGVLYPAPTDAETSAFYDISTYSEYLTGHDSRTAKEGLLDRMMVKLAYSLDRSQQDPVASVLRLSRANPSVCDIGCGSGNFLDSIRTHGATVVGIDPSEVSRKSTTDHGIEFHQGTAEFLPGAIKDRRFDIVTMFQSLEHCRNPRAALQNAKSILKSGGIFVVDVPNMECLGARIYQQAWFHCDAGRHLQFFTPQSLQSLCQSVGLTQIRMEYSGYTGQFTALWIEEMQEVWDRLFKPRSLGAPPRPSRMKTCFTLLATMAAPKRLKYDVVRLYARA